MKKSSFILFFISLIVSTLFAELVLRAFKPQPTWGRIQGMVGSYYAASNYNTFELQKNYVGKEPSMEFPGRYVSIKTTSQGFRGNAEIDPNKETILVLGDSYTFGVYVENDETYPAVLENLVRKKNKNYQVINAGYADGFETDQQYVWLKHNIERIKPSVVILGFFLGNDILGINEEAWRNIDKNGLPSEWISSSLEVTQNGTLKNKNAGINTVGTENIYQIPALRDSHLAILIAKALDNILNIGKRAGYQSEAFQHIYGFYSKEFLEKEEKSIQLLVNMSKISRDSGATFLVALLPVNFMVDQEFLSKVLPGATFPRNDSIYYSRLEKILSSKGIDSINIENLMTKNQNKGPFFPKNGEVHFNPNGNAFTAECIYNYLQAHKVIKN